MRPLEIFMIISFLGCADQPQVSVVVPQAVTPEPDLPKLSTLEMDRLLKLVYHNETSEIDERTARLFVQQLREEYPYESMERRLSYLLVKEDRRRSAPLSPDAMVSLEPSEKRSPGTGIKRSNYRSRSLQLLHELSVQEFVGLRDTFGNGRTPLPSAARLYFAESSGRGFDVLTSADLALPKGAAIDLPSEEAVRPLLSRAYLASMHRHARYRFAPELSFGDVRSPTEVSGFVSHQFSDARIQTQPWDDRLSDVPIFGRGMPKAERERWDREVADVCENPPKDSVWLLKSLQLVSLLKQASPLVYDSSQLPAMNRLSNVQLRPLDEFESVAVDRLYEGDNTCVDAHENEIRMVGALRADNSCCECHDADYGELLGAFTYTLRRTAESVKNETSGFSASKTLNTSL